MEVSQEALGRADLLLERLASGTCGGPGSLHSWLCWSLMLMENPAQLVLHFRFAFLLTVFLLDALFPPGFLLIAEFSWSLVLVILLHVLKPLLVPFLGSSVKRMPDYSKEATPIHLGSGLFHRKVPPSKQDATHPGEVLFGRSNLSQGGKGSPGSSSEGAKPRLRKRQRESL